jgi:hypothetical protein
MIEMPVAQYQSFQIGQLDAALLEDLGDIFLHTQTWDVAVAQVRNGRDRILEIFPGSEIEDQLFTCLVVLYQKGPIREVSDFKSARRRSWEWYKRTANPCHQCAAVIPVSAV